MEGQVNASVNYKCPNCSAPLSFSPGAGKVTCEYCGASFDVGTIEEMYQKKEREAAKAEAKQTQRAEKNPEDPNLQAFTCSSCGAQIVADENTIATECCYCGNPTMLPGRFEGELKPDFVIPFKKTKDDARAALLEFYKGKLLLPNAFTQDNRVEAIQPMYVPFWLFSAKTQAAGIFEAESDSHYETDRERITETSVYSCSREGSMAFSGVPADASQKMQDDYMDSIEPYDYREMVPFNSAYLTGYLADKFDAEEDDVFPRVESRMENTAQAVLADTVTGYDRVRTQKFICEFSERKASYILAPVWILTTKYQGKAYTFMMNGQTGKVAGSLPYDSKKALLYPLIAALVSFPVMYLLASWLLGAAR